jgi:hypothetical protein
MKRTGKDLKTVLQERLNTDELISRIQNSENLPRITRELLVEELIAMKNQEDMERRERRKETPLTTRMSSARKINHKG